MEMQRWLIAGAVLAVAAVAVYVVLVRRALPPLGKIGPVRNIKLATATATFTWEQPTDAVAHQAITYGYAMTSPRGTITKGIVATAYAPLPKNPSTGDWSISVWANDPAGIAGPASVLSVTPGAPVNLRATPNDSDGFLIQWDAPPNSDPRDLTYDVTMLRPDGFLADTATGLTMTSRTTGTFRPRIAGTWTIAAIAKNSTAESNVAHATINV